MVYILVEQCSKTERCTGDVMTTRREKESLQMQQSIIKAAKKVIYDEGFEKLSIRKIAKKLDYAPSIVYYYFKNKEELQMAIMQDGYGEIVKAVMNAFQSNVSGVEKLKEMTRAYIGAAYKMSDEFVQAQVNSSKIALAQTSTLFEGALQKKPALQILGKAISEIDNQVTMNEKQVELKAQMIAVSTLGLIIKLIVEKNIDEKQMNTLIDAFINQVVVSIALS